MNIDKKEKNMVYLKDGTWFDVTSIRDSLLPEPPYVDEFWFIHQGEHKQYRGDDQCPRCRMILKPVWHPVEKLVEPLFCPFCGKAILRK